MYCIIPLKRFYCAQDGVVFSANDAGDHCVGQLLADGQTAADIFNDGASSSRRVLAPQLRVRHSQ